MSTPAKAYLRPDPMHQAQFPWSSREMLAGRFVAVPSLDALPAEAAIDRETCRLIGIKSNLSPSPRGWG